MDLSKREKSKASDKKQTYGSYAEARTKTRGAKGYNKTGAFMGGVTSAVVSPKTPKSSGSTGRPVRPKGSSTKGGKGTKVFLGGPTSAYSEKKEKPSPRQRQSKDTGAFRGGVGGTPVASRKPVQHTLKYWLDRLPKDAKNRKNRAYALQKRAVKATDDKGNVDMSKVLPGRTPGGTKVKKK